MNNFKKILISGGAEVGGLNSFANSLQQGFVDLNTPVEVIAPLELFFRWNEMRNDSVLKILSTTSVFFSPICKSSVCVAHGFPRGDAQGFFKQFIILISFCIGKKFSKLIAVSEYVATHLKAIFNITVDKVIYNPINKNFLEPKPITECQSDRQYITYVGRLNRVKNIDKFLSALKILLEKDDSYEIWIVGSGELEQSLKQKYGNLKRFHFVNHMEPDELVYLLKRTRFFFSGCDTEAFGITYIEALSQGCKVLMPTSGGGVEIFPELIGTSVFLISPQFSSDQILDVIFNSNSTNFFINVDKFSPMNIARQYLEIF